MLRRFAFIPLIALLSGCAEPPSKEMHQAQGAIDAAKAAGAEQYAPDELKGAVEALAQSNVAVSANDYRLALSLALDGRERAQNAAKAAVDARAKARGDAERTLAQTTALVERVELRLKAPETARLPRRTVSPMEKSVATARTTLQEARAALEREDYERVRRITASLSGEMSAALTALNAANPAAARPRKR